MTYLLQETQLIGAPSYGFANLQKGVFSKLQVTKFCLVGLEKGALSILCCLGGDSKHCGLS